MIGGYFVADHREIDALFETLLGDLTGASGATETDASRLARAFQAVAERLERHIRWEEDILFPAVEERAPELAEGPGQVMRMEHVEIRSCLQAAREALAAPGFGEEARQVLQGALRAAESVLAEHNEKEEAVYYPLCDELFTDEEATRLLDRVRGAA